MILLDLILKGKMKYFIVFKYKGCERHGNGLTYKFLWDLLT